MGWDYALGMALFTGGAIVQFVLGEWFFGSMFLVALVITAAVVRRRWKSPPKPSMRVSWENSVKRSRPQPLRVSDIDWDRPLISIATRGDHDGHYVCVSWDDATKSWDLIDSSGRSMRWWKKVAFRSAEGGRFSLTDDEYEAYVIHWGLRMLPQNSYSDDACWKNFG
jgi:hypothetical protein